MTQLAFEGRSENEIGRARISMMARSDLLHARAGYRSARPVAALQIQLATHGRSMQLGQQRLSKAARILVRSTPKSDMPTASAYFGSGPKEVIRKVQMARRKSLAAGVTVQFLPLFSCLCPVMC